MDPASRRDSRRRAIFEQAIGLQGADREGWLASACGEDTDLLAEVEALLAADDRRQGTDRLLGSVLETPVSHQGVLAGKYRLGDVLGEGAFGAVYRARQEGSVAAEVAVKVLKAVVVTRRDSRRFDLERRALTRLDHRNVARILDAGFLDTGEPYLVMELVRGVPITRFVEERGSTVEQRLELFAQVCAGVEHAHQKGLLHRDIKPSNVMVVETEQGPTAKVIDFGIAKIVSSDDEPMEGLTIPGQILGTPGYMSPEQANLSNDLDTRTDVYALGVLLYELLTGDLPFDPRILKAEGLAEYRRLLLERTPLAPSSHRTPPGASPRTLGSRKLSRELDWIALAALAADRGERYPTASALRTDVLRYLRNEPLEVSPPSVVYRLGKFAHRHRAQVVFAASILIVLAAGLVGTITFLLRALEQEERAEGEARAARSAEHEEREQRRLVQAREEQLTSANVDLERLVDIQSQLLSGLRLDELVAGLRRGLLDGVEKAGIGKGSMVATESERRQLDDLLLRADLTTVVRSTLAGELLERADHAIADRFQSNPWVEARLRDTLSDGFHSLGSNAEASRQAERALELWSQARGDMSAEVRASLWRLTRLSVAIKRGDLARQYLDRYLALDASSGGEPKWGAEALQMGASLVLIGRAEDGLRWMERALEMYRSEDGVSLGDRLGALSSVCIAATEAGRLDLAIEAGREGWGFARDQGLEQEYEALLLGGAFGLALVQAGRLDEADEVLTETLERSRERWPRNHPTILTTLRFLAQVDLDRGNTAAAITRLRELWEISRIENGERSQDSLQILNSLVVTMSVAEQDRQAFPLAERLLRVMTEEVGPMHPGTLAVQHNAGAIACRTGRFDLGIDWLRASLAGRRELMGWTHPATLDTQQKLGSVLVDHGDLGEATALLEETFVLTRGTLVNVAVAVNLARVHFACGFAARAEWLLSRVLEESSRFLPEGHRYLDSLRLERARTLMALGALDAARADLEWCYPRLVAGLGFSGSVTMDCARNLLSVLRNLGPARGVDLGQIERLRSAAPLTLLPLERQGDLP
ncbi:MAG: serine/threonine protein kinase [Planctomycetes bacterium]|nr:serine/threonine protein kinase [Planctomycetota bacterium]